MELISCRLTLLFMLLAVGHATASANSQPPASSSREGAVSPTSFLAPSTSSTPAGYPAESVAESPNPESASPPSPEVAPGDSVTIRLGLNGETVTISPQDPRSVQEFVEGLMLTKSGELVKESDSEVLQPEAIIRDLDLGGEVLTLVWMKRKMVSWERLCREHVADFSFLGFRFGGAVYLSGSACRVHSADMPIDSLHHSFSLIHRTGGNLLHCSRLCCR